MGKREKWLSMCQVWETLSGQRSHVSRCLTSYLVQSLWDDVEDATWVSDVSTYVEHDEEASFSEEAWDPSQRP